MQKSSWLRRFTEEVVQVQDLIVCVCRAVDSNSQLATAWRLVQVQQVRTSNQPAEIIISHMSEFYFVLSQCLIIWCLSTATCT